MSDGTSGGDFWQFLPQIIEKAGAGPLALLALLALLIAGLAYKFFGRDKAAVRLAAFVLMLVAVVGFGAAAVKTFVPSNELGSPPSSAAAEKLLLHFYKRDAEYLYEQLPQIVKGNYPTVSAWEAELHKVAFQFGSGPKYVTPLPSGQVGPSQIYYFRVEFDGGAQWRAAITYAPVDKRWYFWRVDHQPFDWPMTMQAQISAATLGDLGARVSSGSQLPFEPNTSGGEPLWTPALGWVVEVESKDEPQGAYCTLRTMDNGSAYRLSLERVLGSCALPVGARIRVWGRLVSVAKEQAKVADVLFLPLSGV